MSELEEKLSQLMNNPAELSRLMSMATALLGRGGSESASSPSPADSVQKNALDETPTTVSAPLSGAPSDSIPSFSSIFSDGASSGDIPPSNGSFSGSASPAIAAALPMLLRMSSDGGELTGERSRQKLNLLVAIKPFLDDTHKHSVDRAISLAKAAGTTQNVLHKYTKGGGSHV